MKILKKQWLSFDILATSGLIEVVIITTDVCINSFTSRLEQTTSSPHIFSKTKVWMGKYLKKSCSFKPAKQHFFKFVSITMHFSNIRPRQWGWEWMNSDASPDLPLYCFDSLRTEVWEKCVFLSKNIGTIRKCSSRAFLWMVMSVGFKSFWQFLYPTLGDRSHHQSLIKG
jgi:hypothetical protein